MEERINGLPTEVEEKEEDVEEAEKVEEVEEGGGKEGVTGPEKEEEKLVGPEGESWELINR